MKTTHLLAFALLLFTATFSNTGVIVLNHRADDTSKQIADLKDDVHYLRESLAAVDAAARATAANTVLSIHEDKPCPQMHTQVWVAPARTEATTAGSPFYQEILTPGHYEDSVSTGLCQATDYQVNDLLRLLLNRDKVHPVRTEAETMPAGTALVDNK